MESTLSMDGQVACFCPGGQFHRAGWEGLVSEVEAGLEKMRQQEMDRRRRRLGELSDAQLDMVDHLTRDLLRHAVLEGLRRIGRQPRATGAAALDEIREMFSTGRRRAAA